MMKSMIVGLLATFVAGICLATAQSSKAHSSSTKTGSDPLTTATKPLTPKSAKSAAVLPSSNKSAAKTTTELSRLERHPAKTTNEKSTASVKAASVPKTGSSDPTAVSNSRTNFKYQKPNGGVQAATPNAHSPNSPTPRVTKPN
jgi:hypothetical protein